MAIKFNTSLNALGAIKKIGVQQDLYDWLVAEEILVKLTAENFEFWVTITDKMQTDVLKVPVTLNTLQMLTAGTLPQTAKVMLRTQLTSVIKNIKSLVEIGHYFTPSVELPPSKPLAAKWSAPENAPSVQILPKGILGQLPPISDTSDVKAAQKPVVPAQQEVWASFDLNKISNAPPIKLRDAHRMYQPVHGTSPGLRYFVVGGNEDVRIAARYTGKNLSIRAEGPGITKVWNELAEAGMNNNPDKAYSSMHLEVNDPQVAAKALGAVLFGLGIPLTSPYPNVHIIAGK